MKYLYILLFGMFTSCTGYQYVATPYYIPVNNQKGDFGSQFSWQYFQFGYTFTDNWSVYTTGFSRRNNGGIFKATALSKENGGEYIQTDKHTLLVLGVGYENQLTSWSNIGVVSGFGLGRADYSNFQDLMHNYSFSFRARKSEFYLQPNVTMHYEDYFDVSVFSKMTMNRYFNINSELVLGDRSEPEPYDRYFLNRQIADFYFLEPGVQIRGGLKNLKLQFLISRVISLKQTAIQYRPFTIYLGFSYKLNLRDIQGVRFKQ